MNVYLFQTTLYLCACLSVSDCINKSGMKLGLFSIYTYLYPCVYMLTHVCKNFLFIFFFLLDKKGTHKFNLYLYINHLPFYIKYIFHVMMFCLCESKINLNVAN